MSNKKLDTTNQTKVKAYVEYVLPGDYKEAREDFKPVDREKYKFDHHFQALKFDIVEKLNIELELIKGQSQAGQQVTIQDLKTQRKLIEKQVNNVTGHTKDGMERVQELFFFLLDRSNYFIKKLHEELKGLHVDNQTQKALREQEDERVRAKIDELTEKVKALLEVETYTIGEKAEIDTADVEDLEAQEDDDDEFGGGATKTFRMKKT